MTAAKNTETVMKIQARQGTFETNSSSVHSLCFVSNTDFNRWMDEVEDTFYNMNDGILDAEAVAAGRAEYEKAKAEPGKILPGIDTFEDWMCHYRESFTRCNIHNYYDHVDMEAAAVPGNDKLVAVSIYAE